MTQKSLGVCYYPEHWPQDMWAGDAARMKSHGLTYVRIGEFAWQRMEPAEGIYEWDWLDQAIETLGAEGLKVVLCTPTPTPPKWLTDAYPEVLRHSEDGLAEKHGSRRHCSVASATYRKLCAGITLAMVERYGENPNIAGWQTDNEYGCHDSTRSYSVEDREAFSLWLARKYGDIAALNTAWGNEFWSQTYDHFAQVDLPNRLTTEPNPSHWLDFCRFFSDMTVEFNREQVAIMRAGSPNRFITHNAMFLEKSSDHWALAKDLDFMSWDSYPLGFLRQMHERDASIVTVDDVTRYQNIGHPDILAFHHDIYRAMGPDHFWVMEQQPGPVNWASQNPAPVDGAVKHWTLEAMAHGASTVSYFRWRQAASAQEQMHTGLYTPWNEPDQAVEDIEDLADELPNLGLNTPCRDPKTTIGIYLDYEACWFFEAMRQGDGLNPFYWTFDWYRAARALGLNIEIFGPEDSDAITDLNLLLIPCMPMNKPALLAKLLATNAHLVFGPRSGSRTNDIGFEATDPRSKTTSTLQAPPYLNDGTNDLFEGLKIKRVESLPLETPLSGGLNTNKPFITKGWAEHLVIAQGSGLQSIGNFDQQTRKGLTVAGVQSDRATYLGFQPDFHTMKTLIADFAKQTAMTTTDLGPDLRLRRTTDANFWFNFGPDAISHAGIDFAPQSTKVLPR